MKRNNRKLLYFVSTVLFLVLVAASNDNSSPEQSKDRIVTEQATVEIDPTRIKVLQRSCASCHGINLGGVPGDGPPLTSIGARYTKEEMREILKNGKDNGRMPKGLLEGGTAQADDLEMMVEWLSQKK